MRRRRAARREALDLISLHRRMIFTHFPPLFAEDVWRDYMVNAVSYILGDEVEHFAEFDDGYPAAEYLDAVAPYLDAWVEEHGDAEKVAEELG